MVENDMRDSVEYGTALEARNWLNEHPDLFLADRFGMPGEALRFVDSLYQARASAVSVLLEAGQSGPALMRLALPEEQDARTRLFALFAAEVEQCGQDFAADPDGLNHTLLTEGMAVELGDPEAEGQWAVESGPPRDIGQTTMELWWD